MAIPIPLILALSQACAPDIAPTTLAAVVVTESGGDPLAIGVNGDTPRQLHPRTAAEAAALAERLRAEGANFDLGLGQINVRNLGPLGLTITEVFEPCRNLQAAAQVLASDYGAANHGQGEQAALRASFSLYNTGDFTRGFRNGYVAKVTAAARRVVPDLDAGNGSADTLAPPPPPPAWDVFARARQAAAGFVVQPQSSGEDQ